MIKKGSLVKMISEKKHAEEPRFYPPVDSIGKVISHPEKNMDLMVEWPIGSTSGNDCWFINAEYVKEVK